MSCQVFTCPFLAFSVKDEQIFVKGQEYQQAIPVRAHISTSLCRPSHAKLSRWPLVSYGYKQKKLKPTRCNFAPSILIVFQELLPLCLGHVWINRSNSELAGKF